MSIGRPVTAAEYARPDTRGSERLRESYRFGAVASVAMLVVLMAPASLSAGEDGPQWTVMVYLDADNNLEPFGVMNLDWLETVGSSADVNFVVLMDTYSGLADLLYVELGESESVGQAYGYPKEVNMADPAVLEEFIEICCADYAAQKYALILWDHGGGWRGLCWDDTTFDDTGVDDCITMVEMRTALADAYATTNEVIDVIGFDLCLMAMPEVAYQVRDYADYIVFSEETVPGAGFPYDAIAQHMVDAPEMDGRALCTVIAEDYAAYYTGMGGYMTWTISAFDMQYMDEITVAVDVLGVELLDSLRVYMQYYQMDIYTAQKYYYPYNVDLKGFALNLIDDHQIDDSGIDSAAELVVEAVEKGVFVSLNGPNSEGSYGMAIYIPSTNEGMHFIKDDYDDVPFATETSWYSFVYAFSNFFGRTWGINK